MGIEAGQFGIDETILPGELPGGFRTPIATPRKGSSRDFHFLKILCKTGAMAGESIENNQSLLYEIASSNLTVLALHSLQLLSADDVGWRRARHPTGHRFHVSWPAQ